MHWREGRESTLFSTLSTHPPHTQTTFGRGVQIRQEFRLRVGHDGCYGSFLLMTVNETIRREDQSLAPPAT